MSDRERSKDDMSDEGNKKLQPSNPVKNIQRFKDDVAEIRRLMKENKEKATSSGDDSKEKSKKKSSDSDKDFKWPANMQ